MHFVACDEDDASAVPGTAIIKFIGSKLPEMLGERFEELFRLRNMQTQKMSLRLGKCERIALKFRMR